MTLVWYPTWKEHLRVQIEPKKYVSRSNYYGGERNLGIGLEKLLPYLVWYMLSNPD